MVSNSSNVARDAMVDPVGEACSGLVCVHKQLLGARFRFESTSEALLALVEAAYGGLPPQRFPASAPDFRVELRLLPARISQYATHPPPVQIQSGSGVVYGVMNAVNYVVVSPAQRRAWVVVSEDMLAFPYHLRYELIEFAVYILAARGQGLVPLHGACIGKDGCGILLLGASGAGKSTLALHSCLHGMELLAEDAVLVDPKSLLATGVANYLHVKADALHFVADARAQAWIRKAPVIRRRSGVEKFEADLRQYDSRLAAGPLKLIAAIFVSNTPADDPASLLNPLSRREVGARLDADQPYAAGQPGWLAFRQKLVELGMHELRRGAHPRASVEALRRFFDHAS